MVGRVADMEKGRAATTPAPSQDCQGLPMALAPPEMAQGRHEG
jgi:hypothetical protein